MTDWKRHATHTIDDLDMRTDGHARLRAHVHEALCLRALLSAARDVVESDALSLGDALAELAEQIKRCDAAAERT